jgi:hypothetical protein
VLVVGAGVAIVVLGRQGGAEDERGAIPHAPGSQLPSHP